MRKPRIIPASGQIGLASTATARGEVRQAPLPALDASQSLEEQVKALEEQLQEVEQRRRAAEAHSVVEIERLDRERRELASTVATFATGGLQLQWWSVVLIVVGIVLQIMAAFY